MGPPQFRLTHIRIFLVRIQILFLPALWVTDSRVRWEPVDDQSALLRVPFDGREGALAQETLLARFDPQTGLLTTLESMRYRDADDVRRILWINEIREWGELNGQTTAIVGAVTWFDQGQPWAVFRIEQVLYNAEVDEYVRGKGL